MILKSLTLEGFKSYKNKTVIDFTKMPLNHLFLIQGKTGSGKSSILDAIIYALYDSDKNTLLNYYLTNSLKENLYQDPHSYKGKTIMQVELEFNYKEQDYKIVRKLNIKNFRKEHPNLEEIIEFKHNIYKGNKMIDSPPMDIHLSPEQFTKSIIIPQNQFDKFLKADAKDKESILKNIFNTEKYELFTNFLKDKIFNIKNQIDKLKDHLENILIKNQIEKSIEDPSIKDILKQKIENYQKKIHEYENEIQKKETQKKESEKLLQQNLNQILLLNDLIENLKRKNELQKKEAMIKNLEEKIRNANKVMDIYPIYKNIQEIESQIKNNSKQEESLKKELSNIQNLLQQKKEIQQQLENQKEIIENKKTRLKEIEKIQPKLNIFKSIQKEIDQIQQEKNKIEEQLKKLKIQYENINQQLETIYKSYFAKQLKENEPCPICGSKEHPHPFREKLDEEPDIILNKKKQIENQIKLLENKLQEAEKQHHKKEIEIQSIKTFLQENQYDLKDIEKIQKDIKKEIDSLIKEIRDYENQTKNLQKEINSFIKQEGEITGIIQQLENQIQLDQKNLKEKNKLFLEFLEKNQITKEEIEKYYLKQEEVNQLQKEVQDYDLEKAKIDSLIEKNSNRLMQEFSFFYKDFQEISSQKQKLEKDNLEIQNHIEELNKKINEYNKEIGTLNQNIKTIEEDLKEFTKKEKEYDKWNNQYKKLETLYNILSNNNPKRISLHRYVIQVYFETVIKFANERLKKIEPRYILKASEEAKTGKRLAGLNIKILDTWEGERKVESLSGGESFYVSLALALGLYDIIHTNFSNLNFDFLFIDEGFGSLDEQTLQKVLATINEIFIHKDGSAQKQVGVISHVESMKLQIPYQIIINNTNGVSEVSYKY